MTQVIGLFSNQTDVEQALNALNTAGVSSSDVQMMVVTPGTAVANSFNLAEPESRHLQQKAQNGGVLIIVNSLNKRTPPGPQTFWKNKTASSSPKAPPDHPHSSRPFQSCNLSPLLYPSPISRHIEQPCPAC